jgi:hypothetical protein
VVSNLQRRAVALIVGMTLPWPNIGRTILTSLLGYLAEPRVDGIFEHPINEQKMKGASCDPRPETDPGNLSLAAHSTSLLL